MSRHPFLCFLGACFLLLLLIVCANEALRGALADAWRGARKLLVLWRGPDPARPVLYGPQWEHEALAVAAHLSDWEWEARRVLNMPPGHPERLVRGNDLAHLEDAIWPDGEWLEEVVEGEDAGDGSA